MQEYRNALNRQQSKQLEKFQQWQQEQIQQQQEKIQKQQEEIEQRHQIQVLQKQQKQEEKFVSYYASDITQIYAERHWSEQLVNDDSVFLFVLSVQGDILYCSETCQGLTGYSANDVVGHTISEFLHPDDQHHFHSLLDRVFEAPLRLSKIQFRWKKKNSAAEFVSLQCIGHSKPDDIPTYTIMPSNQLESNYYAFFAIAQIREPTTADVLAQLKKENQRLQQQLTQYTNAAAATATTATVTPSSSSVIASWMQSDLSTNPWLPSQNLPTTTIQQLQTIKDDPLLASTQFHQDDPLTRRTTLNEEKSKKKTIHDDQAKKVYVTMEEHQCLDCGSTNSPEWRKGPLGRKTLCNACGLRWAKKNKKVNLDE